jgi:collagen type I/II/III/V/XI/XXIV/XXVII alpha
MIKVRILALLSVLALLLTLPAIASAQSVPPHIFIGNATVNGLNAPSGTVITAMIGGESKGSVTVGSNGEYGALHVASGSGSEITFVLDSLTASETATWEQGGASVLALNASVEGGGGSGAAGSTGSTGKAGANGKDGAAGANGSDGATGANGANGKAGAAGANGAAGADGKAGASGPAGPAGTTGGGAVAIFALILSIVALIGVGAVYFLGKQNA